MNYIKVKEAAEKWGVTARRVQDLCKQGKIPGAQLWERTWMLPADAQYPTKEEVKSNLPMPRKTPFLSMTDLYHTPGCAEAAAAKLTSQPEAKALFEADIAYLRGDIDAVYEYAQYFLRENSGMYAVLSAGMLLGLCAMWKGDLEMWKKAIGHICEAPCASETDQSIVELSLAASNLEIRNMKSFPRWFTRGQFGRLPADSHPVAKIYYIRCLTIFAQELALEHVKLDNVKGLGLMRMLPNTVEPFIAQAQVDRTVIVEIYLRLLAAVIYQNSGDTDRAIEHIDAAIALALPDQLLGILAEHRRQLGYLLDDRLALADPDALKKLKEIHKQMQFGWTKLHNAVTEKTVSASLTIREREVARMAAFGYSDQEIADHLKLSKHTVKSLISMAKNKTGTMKRSELAAFI
jgi:DNA-binding CsgD family transcriptional regulator